MLKEFWLDLINHNQGSILYFHSWAGYDSILSLIPLLGLHKHGFTEDDPHSIPRQKEKRIKQSLNKKGSLKKAKQSQQSITAKPNKRSYPQK